MSDASPGRARYACAYCARSWSTPERAANCHPGGLAADAQQRVQGLLETVTDLTQQLDTQAENTAALQEVAATAQAQVTASEEDRAALRAALDALTARVEALEGPGGAG